MEVVLLEIFILTLDKGEWSASQPGHSTLGKGRPITRFPEGWVDPTLAWTRWRKEKLPPSPGTETEFSVPSARATTLHYTTLHHTKWHDTALKYIKLHYTALHCTLHCTTLHYTTQYTTLHCTALHTTLHYTTPHDTTRHCTAIH